MSDTNTNEASQGSTAEPSKDAQSTSRETLDTLVAKHGAASPLLVQIAFAGYDPAVGLDRGREVATERILQSVPGFVVSATACWVSLSAARQASVVGFAPSLFSVLLAETVALRALNLRYDVLARGASYNRAVCEGLAKDTLRDGRVRYDTVLRMTQRYAPVERVKEKPLASTVESAQEPSALALAVDTLATWIAEWRADMSADERAAYATLGFSDALARELQGITTKIRETQAVLAALSDTARVTQRELDEQDGRVLHLVGNLYAAFRAAARSDEGIVLPELGELESVFERGPRRVSQEIVAPVPPPAPAPQPA